MSNLTISGHHLEITPSLHEYAVSKFERIHRHFHDVVHMDVLLTSNSNIKEKEKRQEAECTLRVKDKTIFAESTHSDMYAALDLLADKIDRLVVTYKNKAQDHHHETPKRLM